VKPDVGIASQQCGPFAQCFLDAILTEVALAGLDQRLDFLGGPAFADSDQLDGGRVPFR